MTGRPVRLCVLSFFRNSARNGQARRFMRQAQALKIAAGPGVSVRVIAIWGDSRDGTEHALATEAEMAGLNVDIVQASHGGRVFGSTEEVDRLATMSWLGNRGLNQVSPADDFVWYVESDLLWTAAVPLRLVRLLQDGACEADVIAPMTFAGEAFYDIWAFRLGTNPDGTDRRFSPFHPFHPDLRFDGLTFMDSVGSAMMMRGAVARTARMDESFDATRHALVSFCWDARAKGFRIATDARLRIQHP